MQQTNLKFLGLAILLGSLTAGGNIQSTQAQQPILGSECTCCPTALCWTKEECDEKYKSYCTDTCKNCAAPNCCTSNKDCIPFDKYCKMNGTTGYGTCANCTPPDCCTSNYDCSPSEFCKKGDWENGKNNCIEYGKCELKPEACPTESFSADTDKNHGKICDCNNVTRANGCEANKLGINVAYYGGCGENVLSSQPSKNPSSKPTEPACIRASLTVGRGGVLSNGWLDIIGGQASNSCIDKIINTIDKAQFDSYKAAYGDKVTANYMSAYHLGAYCYAAKDPMDLERIGKDANVKLVSGVGRWICGEADNKNYRASAGDYPQVVTNNACNIAGFNPNWQSGASGSIPLPITDDVTAILCKLVASDTGATYYLDDNCNQVNDTDQLPLCPDFSMVRALTNTPLSLVWENSENSEVSVSNFALNPEEEAKKWVVWRGSEKLPLVVFDPKKSGKITSAEQLFGQHTFGKVWKDGFEALSSLDKNQDAKVSGAELKNLSLWFDKNHDGVSDKGEVVDIRAAGVTELYYGKDKDNVYNGDILAVKGYSRKDSHGNVITGAALDWFSESYASQAQAQEAAKKQSEAEAAAANMRNSFSGMWVWTLDKAALEKGGALANTSGILAINDMGKNIVGRSVVELQLEKNAKNLKSAMTVFVLTGKKQCLAGVCQAKYFIETGDTVTESVIELSADGKTLSGVSRADVTDLKTGKRETSHYTWVAKRLGL
ncbi:MAG: hypothetical protein LBE20_04350 [Deltaproteobacteria bacterium]|jgi:hypothetical protein|nr:hypothetical protein [Deltaproteobacteria bacterium]